jgi:hypothetical protein
MTNSGDYQTASAQYIRKGLSLAARTTVEMTVSDIEYVAGELRSIRRPRRWLNVLASASVGVSATSLFAGLAGLVAGSTLPTGWLVGYFVAGTVVAIFAVVLFIVDRGESSDPERCARRALRRMEAMEIIAPVEEPERRPEWQKFKTWLKDSMPWT